MTNGRLSINMLKIIPYLQGNPYRLKLKNRLASILLGRLSNNECE